MSHITAKHRCTQRLAAMLLLALTSVAHAFDSDRLPLASGHYPIDIFGNKVLAAAISADGSQLWTTNGLQLIRWDLRAGTPDRVEYTTIKDVTTFENDEKLRLDITGRIGPEFIMKLSQLSPSGRYLAGSADFSDYLRPVVWDSEARKLRELPLKGIIVAFSADEESVLVAIPGQVGSRERATRLAWVALRNGKVGKDVFADAGGLSVEAVTDGVSVVVSDSKSRMYLLRPPYTAPQEITAEAPGYKALVIAPHSIWGSRMNSTGWQFRDANGQPVDVALRAYDGFITVGGRDIRLFETDEAFFARFAAIAPDAVAQARQGRAAGRSAVPPPPVAKPAAAPASVVAAAPPPPPPTPVYTPPPPPPPSALDIARNLPLLPSGWRFAGGDYRFVTLPNGNKAIGAVQHCGDASVVLETLEGSNRYSQWLHFTLARYDANGRSAPFGTLATWQSDGGVVALTPELSVAGSGQVTVRGTTTYPNGHRVDQQKSVSACWIQ